MSTTFANWATVTTIDDNGAEILRYTSFRAVIPLDENRRYDDGNEVTVRIEAHDAIGAELEITDDDGITYLFESRIDGVHVDSPVGDLIDGADKVLVSEGFRPAGFNWVWTGSRFTVGLEAAS